MNSIFVFISGILIAFFIFQLIWVSSNYNYIKNFNSVFSKLEYSFNPLFNFDDDTYYDPNDGITDTKIKFRCVLNSDGSYYALSQNGIVSDSSTSPTKKYSNLNDCIYTSGIFQNSTFVVFDACSISSTSDWCKFITDSINEN